VIEIIRLSVDPLTTPEHPDPTSGAHHVRIGDHATTLHLERNHVVSTAGLGYSTGLTGIGLALGQDRHDGVIAVQSLSREDVVLDPPDQRRQHRAAAAYMVGQSRQAERHALKGIAIGLAVERLMLPEFLEQDHRNGANELLNPDIPRG